MSTLYINMLGKLTSSPFFFLKPNLVSVVGGAFPHRAGCSVIVEGRLGEARGRSRQINSPTVRAGLLFNGGVSLPNRSQSCLQNRQQHGRGSGAGLWGKSQHGNAAGRPQLHAQGQSQTGSQKQQRPLGSHLLPCVAAHPGRTHHLPAHRPPPGPRGGLCVPGKPDVALPWGTANLLRVSGSCGNPRQSPCLDPAHPLPLLLQPAREVENVRSTEAPLGFVLIVSRE